MANTGSQAEAIRQLLTELLAAFDPTLDTSLGSPVDAQVVTPVFQALGTDPFDTDIEQFLRDRLRQEFPSVSANPGDPIVDLLIRPLQLLVEALKREIQIVRQGQSVRNSDLMRLEDAEALAANFFVSRQQGSRATGTVRVFYAAPTYVAVLSNVFFSTADGLRFFPTTPQFFSADTLLLQRSGTEYYADVNIIAETVGEQYDVGVGGIVKVSGLSSATRVTNLIPLSGGSDEETGPELLQRTQQALTERSLNTRRGITARLLSEFPGIQNLEVVGFGDPEMERDVVTGGGNGRVRSSGICFIVGQFVVMFSTYEDRGERGIERVTSGDEITLNYWKFLYDLPPEQQHEKFSIEAIVFDTRDFVTENIPSILLLKLDGTPTPTGTVTGLLPGVLPGVFSVITTRGRIEISDIPGGILEPNTNRGTIEVEDGAVHIGGHYDVWVRPSADTTDTVDLGVDRSETADLEGTDLVTNGGSDSRRNQVTREYEVSYTVSTGSLVQGETVVGGTSGASAAVFLKTVSALTLVQLTGEFEVGETVTGSSSGATVVLTAISSYDWASRAGVTRSSLLSIVSGSDEGVYRVLKVSGPFLFLDIDLTTTETDVHFRVLSEIRVDLYTPRKLLVPFADQLADDLSTVIGSANVEVSSDLALLGVQQGDTFEVLEGEDRGLYTVTGFDPDLGGTAPVLSSPMTATNSGVTYRVYRAGTGLQAPVIRVRPGGLELLDPSGASSGTVVPYALPVEARALDGFSGAEQGACGRNGFVLADPGPTWEPSGDLVCTREELETATTCFSDDCLDCDGWIACCSLTSDGKFYLNSELPSDVQDFLTSLKNWFLDVAETFELGDDVTSFIEGLQPVILGPPDTSVSSIVLQFEICIPREVFDGCNNVFVALPEFDWENLFAEADSFAEVLERLTSGDLAADDPALAQAVAGDALTVKTGSNTGAYVLSKVLIYKWCSAGALVDEDEDENPDGANLEECYTVAVGVIDGVFPVRPMGDLASFFASGGLPDVSDLPTPPDFPGTSFDEAGNLQSPWEWVQLFLTWLFQWLTSLGFDLPDSITLDPEETLQAIWQLLFSEYCVGKTTCEQVTRLTFIEPTSLTAYGLTPCAGYRYAEPVKAIASLTAAPFTLPLPDLDGISVRVNVKTIAGSELLEATLGASAAAATTIEDLAGILQGALDPEQGLVIFSGPPSVTGSLSVESAEGGVEVQLFFYATDVSDGFHHLGFFDATAEEWAQVANTSFPAFLALHFTVPSDAGINIDVETDWDYALVFGLTLTVDSTTGFSDGDTITGLTSGATADVFVVDSTTLLLHTVSGVFLVGETVDTGTATATIAALLVSELDDGETITGVTSGAADAAVFLKTVLQVSVTAGTFDHGDAISGGTSSANATIREDGPSYHVLFDQVGDFVVGETITGPSGTAVVENVGAYYLLKATSGVFSAVERVDGATSMAAVSLELVGVYEIFTNVSVPAGTDRDFVSIGADIEAGIEAALADLGVTDIDATVTFSNPGSGYRYTISLSGAGLTQVAVGNTAGFFPPLSVDLSSDLFVSIIVFNGTLTIEGGIPTTFFIRDFSLTVDDTDIPATYSVGTALTYDEAVSFDAAITAAIGGDSSPLAAALNAFEDANSDGSERRVWYVGSELGSTLTVRTVLGGAKAELTLDASPGSGFETLGFPDPAEDAGAASGGNAVAQGETEVGEVISRVYEPPIPTIFAVAAASTEILFVASGDVDPLQVFPGGEETGPVPITELERDIAVAPFYDGAISIEVGFTDSSFDAPLALGVQEGSDFLWLYEQLEMLEHTIAEAEADISQDRVVAVLTRAGSTVIRLPNLSDPDFTFLAPVTTDAELEVEVGDLVFVEEGDDAGGYVVTARSAVALTLNRALTATSGSPIRVGNDGVIEAGGAVLRSDTALFTEDDIGRFLTVWACNRSGYDGSYRITAVTDLGSGVTEATLDTDDFTFTEQEIHWAVLRAPAEDPGDSVTGGRTELVGLRPIRIYRGEPTKWRVARVDTELDRSAAKLLVSLGDSEVGPRVGVRQPYQIVRPGVQRTPSTTMAQQRERGLFYADVVSKSLGGDTVYNVPGGTRMEPVFGTYSSDGYRLETADTRLVFSTHEELALVTSPSLLPIGSTDVEANLVALEAKQFRVTYDFAPLVDQIQRLVQSEADRVLCANPLARHFLPSYVYLDVTYTEGDSSAVIAEAIQAHVEGLEPLDDLDVSELEKVLHDHSVLRYDHPVEVIVVTHDLDRRIVGTRSSNRVGENEVVFNGSNRTSFFIPGPDRSSETDESQVPIGERVYLRRSTKASSLG